MKPPRHACDLTRSFSGKDFGWSSALALQLWGIVSERLQPLRCQMIPAKERVFTSGLKPASLSSSSGSAKALLHPRTRASGATILQMCAGALARDVPGGTPVLHVLLNFFASSHHRNSASCLLLPALLCWLV